MTTPSHYMLCPRASGPLLFRPLWDAERQDALRQIQSLTVSTAHQQHSSYGQHPRSCCPAFSSDFAPAEKLQGTTFKKTCLFQVTLV